MNTTSFIVLSAFGAAFLYFFLMLFFKIRKNVLNGQSFHDSLVAQISNMRMGKMMDALGINKAKYIHQESVLDINHHIDTCNACENTDECDEKLESETIGVEDIKFCGNESSMVEITFKQNDIK